MSLSYQYIVIQHSLKSTQCRWRKKVVVISSRQPEFQPLQTIKSIFFFLHMTNPAHKWDMSSVNSALGEFFWTVLAEMLTILASLQANLLTSWFKIQTTLLISKGNCFTLWQQLCKTATIPNKHRLQSLFPKCKLVDSSSSFVSIFCRASEYL